MELSPAVAVPEAREEEPHARSDRETREERLYPAAAEAASQSTNDDADMVDIGALLIVAIFISVQMSNGRSEIDYGFFRQQLGKKNIASVNIEGDKIYGEFEKRPSFPTPRPTPAASTRGLTKSSSPCCRRWR